MNTKPFASYPIINPHFDKVRLFSQKSSTFNFLNKIRISCSYTSSKHSYISSNIL